MAVTGSHAAAWGLNLKLKGVMRSWASSAVFLDAGGRTVR